MSFVSDVVFNIEVSLIGFKDKARRGLAVELSGFDGRVAWPFRTGLDFPFSGFAMTEAVALSDDCCTADVRGSCVLSEYTSKSASLFKSALPDKRDYSKCFSEFEIFLNNTRS